MEWLWSSPDAIFEIFYAVWEAYFSRSEPSPYGHASQDLGTEGQDTDRIARLAENMRRSHAQTPSLAHPELPDPSYGPGYRPTLAPSRQRAILRLAHVLDRLVRNPDRTEGRTR
jgi:hypothetical protein